MIATLATTTAIVVSAFIPCTNDNYQHSDYCSAPPAFMIQTETGFWGLLENGIYWTQNWVDEETMRFTMQEVDYNITKDGITYND